MESVQKNILNLIRAALTGQRQPLDPDFSLEPNMRLILAHQIGGIIYQGALLCGIPKDDPCMKELFSRYYLHMIRDQRQTAILNKVFSEFEAAKIDYLPLKGTVLKALYPEPGMRAMGDADVLIRMEQYDQIRPVMDQLGFKEGSFTDHELVWDHPHLHLELHAKLVSHNYAWMADYFCPGWQRAIPAQGHRFCFSPEDTCIFLFAHYTKHYRGGGIGLRQLTDLWLWSQAHPQMDQAYIAREMDAIALGQFYVHTQTLLECWFAGGAPTAQTEHMTDFIFSSGSWGQYEMKQASKVLATKRKTKTAFGARISLYIHLIFPSVKYISHRYPIVKKHPWLLPVFWPIRWVSALLFRRKNVRSGLNILCSENIERTETFEQALRYVGLEASLDGGVK